MMASSLQLIEKRTKRTMQWFLFCFVFLLTCGLFWISNNRYRTENSTRYITSKSSHPYALSTYKPSNPFINISLNTTNSSCDTVPAYLISRTQHIYVISHKVFQQLQKLGFNLPCEYSERKRLGLKQMRRNRRSQFCLKFNNTNTFCKGVKLIYMNDENDRFRLQILTIESKTALNEQLTLFCNRYHKTDTVCDFHLLSYNLDNPNQRLAFLTKHIDCNNVNPQYESTWVIKEDIDQGSGIHLINNHQEIYRLITENMSENIDNCTFDPIKNKTYFEEEGIVNYYKIQTGYVINRTGCLIQTFVNNPLLVKLKLNETMKHVFHVRSYLLVASYSNPLIVLHWPRPILMINPNEYNNRQKQLNKQSILTNRHVIEAKGNVIDDSYEWIWGRTQFQKYLDQEYTNDLFGANYTAHKLNNDIKHIAETIFNANSYNNKLKQQKIFENENKFHFDILCMDIIINNKFELKLMEVNAGRCLHFCDEKKLKKKIINGGYDWDCDTYWNEAAEIIMELAKKKSFNHSIEIIHSLNKYEIVFWE